MRLLPIASVVCPAKMVIDLLATTRSELKLCEPVSARASTIPPPAGRSAIAALTLAPQSAPGYASAHRVPEKLWHFSAVKVPVPGVVLPRFPGALQLICVCGTSPLLSSEAYPFATPLLAAGSLPINTATAAVLSVHGIFIDCCIGATSCTLFVVGVYTRNTLLG